jgi:hypothetical protein
MVTLAALCRRIDDLASEGGILDVGLTEALSRDMYGMGTGTGALCAELEKPSLGTLGNLIARGCEEVTLAELDDLVERAEHLIDLLNAVNNDSAPFAQAAAISLRSIADDLLDARQRGVLFVDPILFAERRNALVVYGLTLQREGAAREAQLIFSITLALAGLIPVLSIPATIASVGMALAERAGEQELAALRSSQRQIGQRTKPD